MNIFPRYCVRKIRASKIKPTESVVYRLLTFNSNFMPTSIINTHTYPVVLLSPTTASVVPFEYTLTTAESVPSRTASGVVLSANIALHWSLNSKDVV